jgi:preprotein translocase subunit SecA
MSFWTWLTGKKSSVTATDRIWLTKAARGRGLCQELVEHLSNARPSILLAHFPATLAEVQQELSRQGVPHRWVDHAISAKEVSRLASPEGLVRLGLVKQLQPDPQLRNGLPTVPASGPQVSLHRGKGDLRLAISAGSGDPRRTEHAEREGLIQILVAERHFLRECDEVIITFAEGLGKRCHVTYHCSLEDPLMKVFAGQWIKEVLQRLGTDESASVESRMVARRVRGAQGKFAAEARQRRDANSAEEWLQANGFGEPR